MNLLATIGAPELTVVLVVILVLFGGAKLPGLARSLGQAKSEFQSGLDEGASRPTPEQDSVDAS